MTKTVMMPKELTDDDGLKARLIGEFYSEISAACVECDGTGLDGEGDTCTHCDGNGYHVVRVMVPWTIIKAIYAKAVQHLAT